jgi:glycerophosphoryl diester phosphodiesterase
LTAGFELIAHRGNARDFPENTLPAFASALSLGLRCLELDVHLSADEIPVVIHDQELQRTTGRSGTVFALRAAELTAIEAHEPQRFGERFRGTCLPRLTDVLTLLARHADATLFVEIKRASLRHFDHDTVVTRVLGALATLRAQCVVISFDLPAVARARELGDVRIGWVLPDYSLQSRLDAEALRPDFLFGDVAQLSPAEALWPGPWQWALYEVDAPETATALAARGARYIETMAVAEMSAALAHLDNASAAARRSGPPAA